MKINNKKASRDIGIAIIVIALLFLLGSIITNYDSSSVFNDKYPNNNGDDENPNNEGYIDERYLFHLSETDIGKQKKVTENYPNLELGSQTEFNTIYVGNSFQISSNPFTKNEFRTQITTSDREDVKELLLYFSPDRVSGEEELIVRIGDRVLAQTNVQSSDIPLTISNLPQNKTFTLTLELNKPGFYELFNWNKLDINNFRVVEVKKNKDNTLREFDFQVDPLFLDKVTLDLVISCETQEEVSEPIKASVNGYIVINENPNCLSRYSRVANEVPLNILNDEQNRLVLETEGFYTVAYNLNKVYYNDQDKYKFTINDFSDVIDVVMYGDFDKQVIDIRINNQLISLGRNDIVSVIPYLRFGVNEIEILTKPLEIEELIIEKNEFLQFD